MDNKNYKRQHRELDDATKQKISMALKGRSKSATHSEKISNGLKDYWKQVPQKSNPSDMEK
ncbi:hypothetical protein LJC21_02945 [Bacteroides sp. OttesenSCG-928-E20]|nr:hypothetical protein [Bacteroides sp. OttesenSCG-928-N06]MDL2299646.1 hypothetical protein [Bacteroides sp. OttesenSCG-928-E20]MDL2304238.1 hypothetical protein [Bacteroides sp. OttesenSCG-928-D19]